MLNIAAADTPASMKSYADVVCDGVADQTEINQAIVDEAAGVIYPNMGEVVLLPGTYHINDSILLRSNVTIRGFNRRYDGTNDGLAGSETSTIKVDDGVNHDLDIFKSATPGSVTSHVGIESIIVDGNKGHQTPGTMRGFQLTNFIKCKIWEVKLLNIKGPGVLVNDGSAQVNFHGQAVNCDDWGVVVNWAVNHPALYDDQGNGLSIAGCDQGLLKPYGLP